MNFVIRFTTLLTLLALGACGGGSNDPAPTDNGGNNPPPPPAAIAPTITSQPVDAGANEGSTVTFTVVASGANLTYQWRKNGAAIAGATSASYTTPALAAGDDQATFAVIVTNAGGSVTSDNAKLTVTAVPSPPGGGSDPGPSGEFPHAANPQAVSVTLADDALAGFDTTSTADRTVQVPGGAADIVVQDGVTVSIGVSGDAFLEDQSLVLRRATLAELDTEHPLPFQAVIGAFHLGPADTSAPELQARDLVRITFTLTPEALAALGGQPVIFSARADGSQLHLVPVFANPGSGWSTLMLTTQIAHLGVFGIGTMTGAQSATLAGAWPTYDEFQLEAAIAPASYGLRQAALAAPAPSKSHAAETTVRTFAADDDWSSEMAARTDAFYNDVVQPALDKASAPGAGVAEIREVMRDVLAWERMRQLLGLQDERDANAQSQLIELAQAGLEKAKADCVAHRGGAATAQALGMLRQLVLLGGDNESTADSILDVCGRPRYDLLVDWQQIRTEDLTLVNEFETTAFTGRLQGTTTTNGQVHVAPDGNPELKSVTFDLTRTYVNDCTDISRAWHCIDTRETYTAHDTSPDASACGAGFYGGYRVARWNQDARGNITGPQLEIFFQNSFGCSSTSFIVATHQATRTIEYPRQNRTETSTVGDSEGVNTVAWSGGARVGSSTRIVRSSETVTGQNVQPGSVTRRSTRIIVTVTEVPPTN